jgi:probable rRNA maturation factor
VLSFPAIANVEGHIGDIAISVDIAARNARRLGHTTAAEVRILILHGLLHLAGYDHELDQGEMARREQRMRNQLGLPVGLIERSAGLEGKPLTAKSAKVARRTQRKSPTLSKNQRVRRKAR